MFFITVSFYGHGNKPRKLGRIPTRDSAENQAFYVLSRYENADSVHKRIKKVAVCDTFGSEVTTWSYPSDYDRDYFLHAYREDEWTPEEAWENE